MGIKDRLPLLKSDSRIVRLFGYLVYAFSAIIVLGIILPGPEVDESVQSTVVKDNIDCKAISDELDRARTIYWQNGIEHLSLRQKELVDHCGAGREKDYAMPKFKESTKEDVSSVEPRAQSKTDEVKESSEETQASTVGATPRKESDDWRDSEPTNAHDWVIKGITYEWEDDDIANAIKCFNRALELDPNSKDALTALESLYFGQDDYSRALSYNSKVLQIDPRDTEALSYRGLYLDKLGRPYDAIAVYDQIIDIASEEGDCASKFTLSIAWADKAGVYWDLGNYDLANSCYETSDTYGDEWHECFFGK